jgi:hypothetical protein
MKLLVNIAQSVACDMSINFRRGDGSVSEEFLNDPEISAIFEQVGCEAVAQHVGGNIARNSGTANALFDAQPERHSGKRRAAFGEENVCR